MTPEADGPEEVGGSPTPVGYLIGAVMIVLIAAGIYFALTAGGNDDPGSAHLATPSSGSSNGVQPDERTGTPVKTGTTDLKEAVGQEACKIRADLPDEGNKHLTRDDPAPDYKTVPPTSGPHIGPPLQQADGAYSETPLPEDVVHSLEHGRIAIQYDPTLPEEAQLELKGLYDSAYSGALLFPNPDMPYAVAATAWTNLIGCEEYHGAATLDAIRAFAVENFDNAPEPLDIFPPIPGPSFAD
ncbi:MAG: DUF3105 domain-containing protein [Thermoleophilia bacterium]|nr:DUF3105 domain-containing protein [Thermoleophilia bacterium]